ncbi:hypothetical protein BGZ93_010977 [Podila epicladia]|nr:hypothetical protein BGZ93_010977 [Podila epicladia]
MTPSPPVLGKPSLILAPLHQCKAHRLLSPTPYCPYAAFICALPTFNYFLPFPSTAVTPLLLTLSHITCFPRAPAHHPTAPPYLKLFLNQPPKLESFDPSALLPTASVPATATALHS